jgi:hypothetical protein
VLLHQRLAGEMIADDHGLKMDAVIAADLDPRARQMFLDQTLDILSLHDATYCLTG